MSRPAKVAVTIAIILGVAAMGVFLLKDASSSFHGEYQRCEVTIAGVAERRANGIDDPVQGEADDVVVGKVYQSQSGCIPGDKPVD